MHQPSRVWNQMNMLFKRGRRTGRHVHTTWEAGVRCDRWHGPHAPPFDGILRKGGSACRRQLQRCHRAWHRSTAAELARCRRQACAHSAALQPPGRASCRAAPLPCTVRWGQRRLGSCRLLHAPCCAQQLAPSCPPHLIFAAFATMSPTASSPSTLLISLTYAQSRPPPRLHSAARSPAQQAVGK